MSAPRPWKAQAPNKYYLQIVDAEGIPVCEFFPFARYGGRGWNATLAIAQQIVETMNWLDGESEMTEEPKPVGPGDG
jgi:hypothetical protein